MTTTSTARRSAPTYEASLRRLPLLDRPILLGGSMVRGGPQGESRPPRCGDRDDARGPERIPHHLPPHLPASPHCRPPGPSVRRESPRHRDPPIRLVLSDWIHSLPSPARQGVQSD